VPFGASVLLERRVPKNVRPLLDAVEEVMRAAVGVGWPTVLGTAGGARRRSCIDECTYKLAAVAGSLHALGLQPDSPDPQVELPATFATPPIRGVISLRPA
jgi:hypothetical protein